MSSPSIEDNLPPPPTWKEKHSLAFGFVEAYFGGQVKVTFPRKEDVEADKDLANALVRVRGQAQDFDHVDINLVAALSMNTFEDRAKIIYGSKVASDDERKRAINGMLDFIWQFRMGGRIEGEFLAIPNLEAKISNLEEQVRSHRSLLEELQILVRALGGTAHP